MRKIVIPILLVLFFSACNSGDPQSNSDYEGYTRITFNLPEPAIEEKAATSLLCYNLTDENNPQRNSVNTGSNDIWVEKDAVYIFGFVSEFGASSSLSNRSITNVISSLGNIKILTADLDILPLGNEGTDELNYGDLTRSEDGFESNLGLDQVADDLDYSTEFLTDLGNADDILMKFLNPDINRNGVFDTDQGLDWNFKARMYFTLEYTNADFDSGVMPYEPAELMPSTTECVFDLNSGFPDYSHLAQTDIRLYLPEGANLTYQSTGNPVEYILNAHHNSEYTGFDFDPGNSDIQGDLIEGDILFGGDYRIAFGEDNYYIDDVDFFKPTENFESFIFPAFKAVFHEETGRLEEFSWRWYIQRNGTFVPADDVLVKTMINNVGIEYNEVGSDEIGLYKFPENWWDNGTIDYSNEDLSFIDDFSNGAVHIGFNDAGGNSYYWMQTNGRPDL